MGPSHESRNLEPWQRPQKSGRERRRLRERLWRLLLLGMLLLTLGAAAAHCAPGYIPMSQLSGFSALLNVEHVPDNGGFYTVTQICSALSCALAWLVIRVPLPYPLGLLLIPALLLLGWILLRLGMEFGYTLLMSLLVMNELFVGLQALLGLLLLFFSDVFRLALLQELFYIAMFLFPLGEIIALRKWKESIY